MMVEDPRGNASRAQRFAEDLIRISTHGTHRVAKKRDTMIGRLLTASFCFFLSLLLIVGVLYVIQYFVEINSYRCVDKVLGEADKCDGWGETFSMFWSDAFIDAIESTAVNINAAMYEFSYPYEIDWANLFPLVPIAIVFLVFTRPIRRLLLGRSKLIVEGDTLRFGRKSYLLKHVSFEPDRIITGGGSTGRVVGTTVYMDESTPSKLVPSGRINMRYGDNKPIQTLIYAKRDNAIIKAVVDRLNEFVGS